MKLTKQKETEIIDAYNQFWVANLSANMEEFASYLVDDFSIFGSANGETFFSKQEALTFYTATADQLKGKAELRNRNTSIQPIAESSVIVRELSDLYVLIGENWTFYGHARITCVLQQINNEWKAAHQHASFADHRTEEGQQIATEKIEKENLELREAVQRRTVELEVKSRALEIEAAVERVRAQSMAMQQTNDIAKVNEELFAQISKLNIDGFTGVAIYLVDEDEMVTVWDLSSPGSMGDASNGAFIYDPKNTPTLSEFIPIWKEGKLDYFILDYPKERLLIAVDELEPFYPAMAENFRVAINSGVLQHQWNATATISNGILSLDMIKPPSEEVRSITIKMAAAFNLAYQRFHDLQMAEKQTRESQIQLALERVRAKTMAMHQSDELANTASILFQQIKELGFETWSCGFCIWKDETNLELWMGADSGGLLPPLVIPYKEEQTHYEIFKTSEQGAVSYEHVWEGNALEKHYEFLATIPSVKEALVMMKAAGLTLPNKQCYYVGFFKKGYLLLITKEPNPRLKEISQRFAQVFDLTYTRFLDLQKAEQQTRSAQIELAVERVRAKALAMHSSTQIMDVVSSVKTEMLGLEIPGVVAATIYLQEEDDDIRMWDLSTVKEMEDGFRVAVDVKFKLSETNPGLYIRRVWNNENKYFVEKQVAADMVITLDWLRQYYPEQADEAQQFLGSTPWNYLLHPTIQLTHGKMSVDILDTAEPAEMESIMIKMGAAFDLAYKRFLDLQQSERQIREGQIELALERVRARSLAMHKSEELGELSLELVKQVQGLGVSTWFCAFNIYSENYQSSLEWGSNGVGTFPTYPTPREHVFLKYYEAGQNGENFMINVIGEDECPAHYEYLCSLPGIGQQLLSMKADGIPFPPFQIDHVAFMKYGYLLFITYEPVPQAHDIFIRFAKVFEQTYTRFLDLKKAETLAAKADADLILLKEEKKRTEEALNELQITQKQLIQVEKMASLGELTAGIAHEIQNPLNFVNNFSEVSRELIEELKAENAKLITDRDDQLQEEILNDLDSNLKKINHHGKRADAIVKGMLQHSRKSEGQKEPTDINALCDEYFRLAYHGIRAKEKSFNATLKTDFDKSIGKINIMSQDMGRVILNLITNAFYAVNEQVKRCQTEPVEVRLKYEPTVSISTKEENGGVEIIISDNGNGIPQNIIDKIFQPFFTTKPTGQGTGLGLSLAYDIVKAHGGNIKVETKSGESCEFKIQLPKL